MLNNFSLNSFLLRKSSLAFTIITLLICLNCGKRKPPVPPDGKVLIPTAQISGVQQGHHIIVSYSIPLKNGSEFSNFNVIRADIFRLTEPLAATSILTEEDFANRSILISSTAVNQSDFAQKRLAFSDNLNLDGQTGRLFYAIRLVNRLGQKGDFSNFLLIEPIAKVALNPTNIVATTSENAVLLDWNAPTANADGSKPVNILGYNIYRAEDDNDFTVPLNSAPITTNHFSDMAFEFENNYKYLVRAMSLGREGEPIESGDSNTISIKPKDIYAPSPPNSITIAAASNVLSIFFASNIENDISGYKIYRTTDPNTPLLNWKLLTLNAIKKNTFQDFNIESGTTYYYYLVAFDNTGNASEPSKIISETAP